MSDGQTLANSLAFESSTTEFPLAQFRAIELSLYAISTKEIRFGSQQ